MGDFTPILTYVILGITGLVSYKAFEDPGLKYKLMFNAYQVKHRKEYYRMLSHGIIHADWTHLLINAFVLYSFGRIIEFWFIQDFGVLMGRVNFLILYIGGVVLSSVYSLAKHQDNPNYNSLGASGATSAVLYSFILIAPNEHLQLYFFIPIKAWIFGIVYLLYSHYMAKKNMDNIGHEAHISGAIYGVVITAFFEPELLSSFIEKLLS